MTYLALEQSILGRLSGLGTGFDTKPSPEFDAEFERGITKTTIEVQYHSSVFPEADFSGRPGSMVTDGIDQQEYARTAVMVRGNKLRGPAGVLAALAAVKTRLVGFKPNGAQTALTLSKVELSEREKGIWFYTMLFSCSLMVINEIEEEEGEPLVEVIYDDQLTGDEYKIPQPE